MLGRAKGFDIIFGGELSFPLPLTLLTSVTFIKLVKIIHTEECPGAGSLPPILSPPKCSLITMMSHYFYGGFK